MELLVTITIIMVLAALVSANWPAMRERADVGRRLADLKQIGTAMLGYAGVNNACFPVSGAIIPYGTLDAKTGEPSWQEQLLPYLDGNRRIFGGPNPRFLPDGSPRAAYFNGSRAPYLEAKRAGAEFVFAAVHQAKITSLSKYILLGEIAAGNFTLPDMDCDNYSQEPAFGAAGTAAKPVGLLFADGHAGMFRSWDDGTMTMEY